MNPLHDIIPWEYQLPTWLKVDYFWSHLSWKRQWFLTLGRDTHSKWICSYGCRSSASTQSGVSESIYLLSWNYVQNYAVKIPFTGERVQEYAMKMGSLVELHSMPSDAASLTDRIGITCWKLKLKHRLGGNALQRQYRLDCLPRPWRKSWDRKA